MIPYYTLISLPFFLFYGLIIDPLYTHTKFNLLYAHFFQSSAVWVEGRSPLELLEVSQALEFFISAIRLEKALSSYGNACIQVKFLGSLSPTSTSFVLNSKLVYPVNFPVHMKFNKAACRELSSEIENVGEGLACEILLLKSETKEIIGTSTVNFWIMIEDSCNIVRQVDYSKYIYYHEIFQNFSFNWLTIFIVNSCNSGNRYLRRKS